MKKIIAVLACVWFFANVGTTFASSVMDNAVRLFEVEKNYKMTIMVIDKGFLENKISDDERSKAYQMQGYAYRELGYHSESREAFDKAIAAGMVGYRENQWILLLNADHIMAKKEEIKLYISSKGESGKAVVADIAQLAHNELASGDPDDAEKLFNFLVELEVEYKNKAFWEFFEKGKTKKGKEAEKYADKAVRYASTQETKEKAGKLYLKAATELWPDEDYVAPKNKAVPLVGVVFVKEVFPEPKPDILFEKSYTISDANEKGWVKAFEVKKLPKRTKPKDLIMVIAELPNKKEVFENDFKVLENNKWVVTDNGNYSYVLKYELHEGEFYIKITNKDIKAKVSIVRKIDIPPKKFEI